MKRIRWGIMATGFIAGRFAEGVESSRTGDLVGVSSRSAKSAASFARQHHIAHAFDSHQSLLESDLIDAVYIATPHPYHAEWAIAAAEAGKHILCEKPMAMNLGEIASIHRAAHQAKVTVMEAYMYRCHPQTAKLYELIRKGKLGKVRYVQASFGFAAPFDKDARLFNKELGGGAILDVGGYPVSMACMVADADAGEFVDSPLCCGASGRIDSRCGTDTIAHATLNFPNGIDAHISVSTQLNQQNSVRIYGDEAWLEITQPWIIAPSGGEWEMSLHKPGKDSPKSISGWESRQLYGVEADCFAELVFNGETEAPCMDERDTIRVNRILSQWREQLTEAPAP